VTPTVTPTPTATATPKLELDVPRNPLVRPGGKLEDRWASVRPPQTPGPKWGLPQPVAVVAMAGDAAGAFGLVKPLVPPTVTPTPFSSPTPVPTANGGGPTPTSFPVSAYSGCHQWRYTLHWDRPSRLAVLKSALGNSVTIYQNFKAPGNGTQDDWPDPLVYSIDWTGAPNAGAWNWKSPPASANVSAPYDHDCGDPVKGPPCSAGETPNSSFAGSGNGIMYEAGYVQRVPISGPDNCYPFGPQFAPAPCNVFPWRISAAVDLQGAVVDWQWTLNYGYSAGNDIIYGGDPGPPFKVYDMTTDTGTAPSPLPNPSFVEPGSSGLGGSIPGLTGTPLAFSSSVLTTRGNLPIKPQTVTPPPPSPPAPKTFITYYDGTVSPDGTPAHQPSWQSSLPADVVGATRNQVNWGLMTFQDTSPYAGSSTDACTDSSNYNILVPIVSNDSGDVSAIEDYLRLQYYNSGAHPGLSANGGTPTRQAIKLAGDSITTSWNADPKKQCLRPWGIILCTDGASTVCNTGPSPGYEWGYTGYDLPNFPTPNPPCEADLNGTDYVNYPPGDAEKVYNLRLHIGGGEVIKPRTYAVGIAPEINRCELDRIAYRGRSDANAPRGDGGFLLFDPGITGSCLDNGDSDLPYQTRSPNPTPPPVYVYTDENGNPPQDRFRQDTPAGPGPYDATKPDYAFFAQDSASIVSAFETIVNSTAAGDYSTSAPVSGGGVQLGSVVLLPSTEYPSWKGHLRSYDTAVTPNALLWDAADVLNSPAKPWQPTPDKRAIYTWDPATGVLIPVDSTGLVQMQGLVGGSAASAFTANVVDFIRGFDGTLTGISRFQTNVCGNMCKSKGWLLGPVVNSTPAIIGGPFEYKQFGNVADHRPFEATYAARRPLAWIGSDDGMLHAFDFNDGTEVLALLPPNLLANQISLYANYQSGLPAGPCDAAKNVTGQVGLDGHIYGVANSFRFTDVYTSTGYKTVGFLTEGPGGDLLAALDITHPFPGRPADASVSPAAPAVPKDPNYDATKPVQILWTKNSSDYPGLFGSWSVPAVAPDTFSTSRMFFGAGINPASLLTSSVDATEFVVDPTDGTLNKSLTLAKAKIPSPLVGQQSFADGVFFQTKAPGYLPDNVANLSLQADLNGQIWFNWGTFTGAPGSAVGIDLNSASGTATVSTTDSVTGITRVASGAKGSASPQPVYYSPAATGQGTSGCQIYAMASGSLYETSPTVSGWNVSRSSSTPPPAGYDASLPSFTPYLYVAIGPSQVGDTSNFPLGKDPNQQYVVKQRIGGEFPDAIPLPAGDPALTTGQTKLGPNTQVTASPVLIADSTGTGSESAVFLLYDPDTGCNGTSYVVTLTFQSGTTCSAPSIGPASDDKKNLTGIAIVAAGPGAASGITFTKTGLVAAQSGVGATATASLKSVDFDIKSVAGNPIFQPVWWRDVK
jgi:hypothetical protein